MDEDERDAFEIRLIEDKALLEAVKKTDEQFSSGDYVPAIDSSVRKLCTFWLIVGLAIGMLLGLLLYQLI